MEKIGQNTNTHTITVDLNAVRALATQIARHNEGLETSGGEVPDDLDHALEILCKGPAMNDFRTLLSKIIEIHREVHNEWAGQDLGFPESDPWVVYADGTGT